MSGKTLLNRVVEGLRGRLFTVEEFPFIDRSILPQGGCLRAMELSEDKLPAYALSLTGKELEAMILDFPHLETRKEWERAGAVLSARFSPRLVKLIFSVFQSFFRAESMVWLAQRITEEANSRKQFPREGSFFWSFAGDQEILLKAREELEEGQGSLDAFFQAYGIGADTPLAMELRFLFLKDGDGSAFLLNRHHFVSLIKTAPDEMLHPVLENYLELFDRKTYSEAINLELLERMGEPSPSSEWAVFPEGQRREFSRWCFLYRLKTYVSDFPKKYEVLSRYISRIKESRELLEGAGLVMDLGEIVIVDIRSRPYSYFYEKAVFEKEMENWREYEIAPTFLSMDEDQITARDFIIEEKDSPCMVLQYEGIDLFYIEELLDIKTGKEPDLRKTAREMQRLKGTRL